MLKGGSHRKILVDVLPVRRFDGGDEAGVVIVGRNSTHDGADSEYLRTKMEADARAAAEALEAHLSVHQRLQAMEKLNNIMAAWLCGSIRGYLLNWGTKWKNVRYKSDAGTKGCRHVAAENHGFLAGWGLVFNQVPEGKGHA